MPGEVIKNSEAHENQPVIKHKIELGAAALSGAVLSGAETTEKKERTADDFRVNVEDYPIFSRQGLQGAKEGEKPQKWNIDRTLAEYLKFTTETIGLLDGSSGDKIDHVIYLDKSARPVSWLVDEFWDDLAKRDSDGNPVSRPEKSYLNIDRIPWFRRAGLEVNDSMHFINAEGDFVKASFGDFLMATKNNNALTDNIADIRALYNPDGRATDETTEDIFKKESPMKGKNIMVIDEISDTGATAALSKWLLEKAFPEAKSVKSHVFANFGRKQVEGGESQMLSSVVWYPNDHSWDYGRGALDPSEEYWTKEYEKDPTPQNYAKARAGYILSQPMNLDTEPGGESKELLREVKKMREDFEAHKIFYGPTLSADEDRQDYWLEAQGTTDYAKLKQIKEDIAARPADDYYSKEYPGH